MNRTQTTGEMMEITTRVTDPPLTLYVTETAFRPNPTTVRFSRTVQIKQGDVVFDIGTGIGPLAIMAAMRGASRVCAVDPVPMHVDLARRNVERYSVEDRVSVYCGRYFEPFQTEPALAGLKADVIIGDVSGIAEPIARALGWYSDDVPTGGYDGADVIVEFLSQARHYLKNGGTVYFPIAVDLSDCNRILEAARSLYEEVDNAMDRPTVNFPLDEREVQAIHDAYEGECPSYINVQEGRRPHWRGQIWSAAKPRL